MAENMKINDVMNRLGIDPELITEDGISKEEFENAFKGAWIARSAVQDDDDLIDPIIKAKQGQRMGAIQTAFKSGMKEIGIDLSKEDLEDEDGNPVKLEKVIGSALTKVGTQIQDLKNAGDSNEQVTKLESQNQVLSSEVQSLTEKLGASQEALETAQSDATNKINTMKMDIYHGEIMKSINFVDNTSDLVMTGFNAFLNDSVSRELDDEGNLRITQKDGKAFRDEKGTELSPKDVYEILAKDKGILKQNNGSSDPAPPPTNPPPSDPAKEKKQQIHPAVQKRIEENQAAQRSAIGS